MKVFTVNGTSKSGKTTTIERIIVELRRRGYSVGSVKDIHFEDFAIDTPGTNTFRHRTAGSQLVTARGPAETDVLIPARLAIADILRFYDHDWVILEGTDDFHAPSILCAHDLQQCQLAVTPSTFVVSGVVAASIDSCGPVPALDALTQTEQLVDLIEQQVFPVLPNVDPECCSACGSSCAELVPAILSGRAQRDQCALDQLGLTLRVGERELSMVPFVQEVIRRTVEGLVSTLDGYQPGVEIQLRIGPRSGGAG